MNQSKSASHSNKGYSYIVLLVILACVIFFSFSNTVNADNGRDYRTIYVNRGDTLWNIAREYHGGSQHLTEKQFVAWVEQVNGINGDDIAAQQKLIIPVSKK